MINRFKSKIRTHLINKKRSILEISIKYRRIVSPSLNADHTKTRKTNQRAFFE